MIRKILLATATVCLFASVEVSAKGLGNGGWKAADLGVSRATARGNLPSAATGDCFVVSLLAMTVSCEYSFPPVSEWLRED